jgi:hypothetical protein
MGGLRRVSDRITAHRARRGLWNAYGYGIAGDEGLRLVVEFADSIGGVCRWRC